jgi:hypothetical protein
MQRMIARLIGVLPPAIPRAISTRGDQDILAEIRHVGEGGLMNGIALIGGTFAAM